MTTLGSLLVQNHVVGVEDIEKALQRQVLMGGDLATNMLELSLVKEDILAKYTARAFGMPLLDKTLLDTPNEKLVKMIPWEAADKHHIVPVALEGKTLTIATFQPIQERELEEIGFLLGVDFAPHFVLEFRLAIALYRCFGIKIPKRFSSLQKKLAPETITDAPPIKTQASSADLVSGVDPRKEEKPTAEISNVSDDKMRDEAETVPADNDYYDSVETLKPEESQNETVQPCPGEYEALLAETAEKFDSTKPSKEPVETGDTPEQETKDTPKQEPADTAEQETEDTPEQEPEFKGVDTPDVSEQESAEVAEAISEQPPASELEAVSEPPTQVVQPEEVSIEQPKTVFDLDTDDSDKKTIEKKPTPKVVNLETLGYSLLQVTHRDEVIQTFMKSLEGVFEYAMLFVIQGSDAHAYMELGVEGTVQRVKSPVLAVDSGGMLEIAYNTRSFYLGQPGKNDTDRLLLHEMNRRKLRNCAIVPFSLRNRVIMLLYCDSGAKGVKADQMSDLSQVARLTSEAFERLLLEKKYGQYRADSSQMPSKPAHPAFSKLPGSDGRLSDMPQAAGLYRFVSSDDSGKLRPSMAAGEPKTSMMRFSTGPGNSQMDTATRRQMAGMASLVKSLAPEKASFGTGAPQPSRQPAHIEFTDDDVQASRIINVASQNPPRSVMVNMTEEIDRLVTRIVTSKRFDKVAVEVAVGIGDDAVAKLIEHFPGPLLIDRHQINENLPRVGRHGNLLRALTKFGKIAVPHILPLLSSRESDVRFYATFLFSELKYPEALDTLTERLFDSDRHIRAIAVDVIRSFNAHPEYRWAISKIISILESTESDLETKYLATSSLGELGEPLAVEALAKLLSSADEKLTKVAHRSLTKIVLMDHGYSEKRWLDWHQDNRNRSRIEWAIDGLTNEDDDIRTLAFRALKERIGEVIEETDKPSNLKEYKELQAHLNTWWDNEGREIHQIVEGS